MRTEVKFTTFHEYLFLLDVCFERMKYFYELLHYLASFASISARLNLSEIDAFFSNNKNGLKRKEKKSFPT